MRAFVAMPFAKEFDPGWKAIQEVCQKCNVDPIRVDQTLSQERSIAMAILKEIADADFMIAVLTGDKIKEVSNPNVTYESGYAQALGKEVIFLAESVDCLPYDFRHQRAGLYGQDFVLFRQLLEREIQDLQPILEKRGQDKMKVFFEKIAQYLRILYPQYRQFETSLGFQDDRIWHGIYFFKSKYFLQYTTICGRLGQPVEIHVWLGDEILRPEQKDFLRPHYEKLAQLKYSDKFVLNLERKELISGRLSPSKSLMLQPMPFDTRSLSNSEALQTAEWLGHWIEVIHPLSVEFAKSKNLE